MVVGKTKIRNLPSGSSLLGAVLGLNITLCKFQIFFLSSSSQEESRVLLLILRTLKETSALQRLNPSEEDTAFLPGERRHRLMKKEKMSVKKISRRRDQNAANGR